MNLVLAAGQGWPKYRCNSIYIVGSFIKLLTAELPNDINSDAVTVIIGFRRVR